MINDPTANIYPIEARRNPWPELESESELEPEPGEGTAVESEETTLTLTFIPCSQCPGVPHAK